jgi:ribonuclease D
MNKILFNKFDKSLISSLPTENFEGRIVVVISPEEAEKAVNYLLSQPILGVDTETRPSFKRGWQYKVALLQVAAEDICFLFRLNHLGLAPALIRLLEDKTTPKIGLSWHDDLNGLHRLGAFTPGNFIDLQDHVKEIGIEDLSLQKLYANMMGKRISKRQQLSNWERDILDDKQKLYAATDAWACIQLYKELMRLEQMKDYELIIKEEKGTEDETNISEEG